jgi:hypothetical protein
MVPEFLGEQDRELPQHPVPASNSDGPTETGWFTLISLVIGGLTGGVLFGMAKYGTLTGPWVIIPVLIFAALAVARLIGLR